MASPAADLFDTDPKPARRPLGLAPLGQQPIRPAEPGRERELLRISPARTVLTLALAGAGAVAFSFPLWAVFAAPPAFVFVQSVRRHVLRWAAWSVLLAAYVAEAMVPRTFELRFAVLLLLFAPLVTFIGWVLRGL